jgi:hypothetical protein
VIAHLRRLLAEGTPGKLRPDGWHVYVGAGMRKRDVAQTFTEQDARLIAAAVNALPRLIDVVEAYRAEHPPSKCNGDCHGLASPGPCGACAEPSDHLLAHLEDPTDG